jgi:hypothetical protein
MAEAPAKAPTPEPLGAPAYHPSVKPQAPPVTLGTGVPFADKPWQGYGSKANIQ